jgi:tRNA pseudouridine55 synthase
MKVLELSVIEPLRLLDSQAVLKVYLKVSKGSYIRSMVQYLSDVLDIPAHLGSLVRTHSGRFDLSQAIALSEVTPEMDVIPIEQALGFPVVHLTPELAKEVSFGKPIPNEQQLSGHVTLMTTLAQAIYHAEGDWLIPDRIFVYEDSSHSTTHND